MLWPIDTQQQQWSNASTVIYSKAIASIAGLLSEPEMENGERLRPTPFAISSAIAALNSAYSRWVEFPTSIGSVRQFPKANVIPADEGGLRD